MPAGSIVVCDDLGLRIDRAQAVLSQSEAFTIAEKLIRTAAKALVLDAAERRDALGPK